MDTNRFTAMTRPIPRRRRVVASGLGLAAALVLTACGDGDSDAAAGSAGHNEADVAFVQQMIPHHEQAVMMAEMAEGRAESEELVDLAGRIEAAQGPEIEQMQGLLEGWGEEADASGMGHGEGHEGMAGMMDEGRMDDLRDGSGAGFDQMWLESMIEHHEGAVEMSETQLDKGEDPEALALADQIIEAQEAEIIEMQAMLSGGS